MAIKGSKFKKYRSEFKVRVVEAYLSGRYSSYEQVAREFEMRNVSQVKAWTKRYRTEGPESLAIDKRAQRINPKLGKHFREKNIENWPLEQQVEYLKMENAILKKVKALRLRNSREHNDT